MRGTSLIVRRAANDRVRTTMVAQARKRVPNYFFRPGVQYEFHFLVKRLDVGRLQVPLSRPSLPHPATFHCVQLARAAIAC